MLCWKMFCKYFIPNLVAFFLSSRRFEPISRCDMIVFVGLGRWPTVLGAFYNSTTRAIHEEPQAFWLFVSVQFFRRQYQLKTSVLPQNGRILVGQWSSTGLQLHVQAIMTKMNTCGIHLGEYILGFLMEIR